MLQKKLINEQKIIVFEKSHFLIREPNTEELEAFMADNPSTTNNNINTDTNTNNNTSSTDLYPSTVEEIYHNVGKYTCLGVLEKEKDISDIIIEYKTKKNYNYDNINKKKRRY